MQARALEGKGWDTSFLSVLGVGSSLCVFDTVTWDKQVTKHGHYSTLFRLPYVARLLCVDGSWQTITRERGMISCFFFALAAGTLELSNAHAVNYPMHMRNAASRRASLDPIHEMVHLSVPPFAAFTRNVSRSCHVIARSIVYRLIFPSAAHARSATVNKNKGIGPATSGQLLPPAALYFRELYQFAGTAPCCIHLALTLTRYQTPLIRVYL